MKNFVRYLQVIPATLLVVACANQKDPVTDLQDIRGKANQPQPAPTAPVTPQVIHEPAKPQPPAPPVHLPPKVVNVPEYITKEVERIRLVERINSDYIIITPPPNVVFTEGVAGSFTFKVRCTLKDCNPSLTAEALPEGARLNRENSTEPSTAIYKLSWTPRIGITDPNLGLTGSHSTFKASATAKDADLNKALQGIISEEVVSISVTRAPIDVKEVRISGLPTDIQAGQDADFTVTARISGIDSQGAAKPTITIIDDESIATPGGPVEMAGGVFVKGPRTGSFENNNWVFKLKFNTKSFQRPKDLNSDTARAGFGVQVCVSGVCADVKTAKVNIKYPRETPAAPAVVAPAPAPAAAPAAKKAAPKTPAKAETTTQAPKAPSTKTPAAQRAPSVGQK